jgi:hypothetical protein
MWQRLPALIVLSWSWGLALTLAIFGHWHGSGFGATGGAVAVIIGDVITYGNRRQRERIVQVMRRGRPSGDRTADELAVRVLRKQVQNVRSVALVGPILFTVGVGLAVAAAIRTGTGWWLLLALPTLAFLPTLLRRPPDRRPQLAALELALRNPD